MKKMLLYQLTIVMSVIDILGIIFSVAMILYGELLKPTVHGTFANAKSFSITDIPSFVWAILCAACVIGAPYLNLVRQKLRDEVEYDENGVSKKFGKFSKLSAQERKVIEQQKMIDTERILDSATLRKITHKGEENPDAATNTLIGLPEVKKSMHEMAARMQYEKQRWKDEHKRGKFKPVSAMHMIFMGPPGTGKTTMARIMTGYLYKNQYIKKNQCVEVDGNFFRGTTPGETSKKTALLIQNSIGGVLFIDEAYAILSNSGGQEAIATIVKAMEDHKDDLIFIMAGYEKEMRALVKSNPGIESRVKHYMYFGDYSINDMKDIFTYMANKENFCISAELMNLFVDRMFYEQKQPNFGNARTIRNLLDKMIDKHATNMIDGIISAESKYILMECDMPAIDKHKHL